jgi:hypothetical protein
MPIAALIKQCMRALLRELLDTLSPLCQALPLHMILLAHMLPPVHILMSSLPVHRLPLVHMLLGLSLALHTLLLLSLAWLWPLALRMWERQLVVQQLQQLELQQPPLALQVLQQPPWVVMISLYAFSEPSSCHP